MLCMASASICSCLTMASISNAPKSSQPATDASISFLLSCSRCCFLCLFFCALEISPDPYTNFPFSPSVPSASAAADGSSDPISPATGVAADAPHVGLFLSVWLGGSGTPLDGWWGGCEALELSSSAWRLSICASSSLYVASTSRFSALLLSFEVSRFCLSRNSLSSLFCLWVVLPTFLDAPSSSDDDMTSASCHSPRDQKNKAYREVCAVCACVA
mmetsp:Transcript_37427/g.93913  ORF Transcript_37427/g.93913 Transcript_37427/m.93913 type:complete len:216 (-) Transcript_37427:34-681(-)